MSVVTELRIPAGEFELGRILAVEGDVRVTLETMVPLGQAPVPFFIVRGDGGEEFADAVSAHPLVDDLRVIYEHEAETLFAMEWDASADPVFEKLQDLDAQLLEATGDAESWAFELRFNSHGDLSAFQEYCNDAGISLVVERIYNPTKPESGPLYGLTPKQREALLLAFEAGYYSIPRKASTNDLAAELGVSDQAVTERLRRGTHNLIEHTIVVAESIEADQESDDEPYTSIDT